MENQKIKILAIDDITDNLISLKALITDIFPGAETITAQTGISGLELAETENPDIILLDIVMPGMDGFEVCRKLKGNEKLADIPVVFLTALKGEKESRIKALEAGAEAFLTKPIDESELTAQIRAMIKIRNANLKNRDEKAWLEMLVNSRTKALENELAERKKAELALKQSEAKFRYVFEAANVGKSITDINGKMFVNQAFCDMLGYTYDEMADKSWQEITPPEDIVEVNRKIEPLLKGETDTIRFTKRYVHKNGTYIIADLSTAIQRNDKNKPAFFITTVVDITEQKKAAIRLKESEEKFRELADMLPQVVFETDSKGNFVYVNRQASKVYGFADDFSPIGMNSTKFHVQQELPRVLENVKKRLAGELVENNEYQMVKADGTTFQALVFSTPVMKDAKPSGLRGIIVDISAQKKAEEAIRQSVEMANALLNGLPESAFLMKPDGTVIAANNTVAERLNTTVNALINKNIYPLVDADTAIKRAEYTKQVIQSKKPVQFFDERFGKTIDNRIHPVIDASGNVESLAIIGIDITQLRQNEISLLKVQAHLGSIFKASPVGIGLNKNRIITEINDYFCTLTGYSRDELIGQSARILYPSDEDFEFVGTEKYRQIEESGIGTVETRLLTKQGNIRNIILSSSPLNPEDLSEGITFIGIDITDRKKAELEALHQREMLARTEQIAGVGSWEWEIESDVVYWSDELFRMFGLIPGGFAPPFTSHSALYVEEDFKKLTDAVKLCMESGTQYELELRRITVDRQIKYCVARGQALRNNDGKIVSLAGSLQDINDKKIAELAYWESQTNFKALFEKGPIAVAYHQMIYNETGDPINYRFLDANSGYQELTGVNPVGKLVTEAFPGIENDPFNWIGTFGKVARTGTEIRFQQYLESNQRWYDCVGYQYKPDHFVAAFLEITEHKKAELALLASEERFALVIDATEQGIWDWNIETNEVFYSEQWKKIIGYKDDELKNEFGIWVDHLHPDERESCIKSVEDYLKNPIEHFILEFRFRHKDGTYRWIHNKASSVKNSEGKVIRMFGAHTDITERKKTEKALQHASENWNTTFRAIKSGILLIDDKQRIIQSNEAFQDFVGKTTNELYQNCCYTFVHGADCAIDDCPFTRMKKSKQRETLELILKGTNFEVIVDPILNEKDQITGAVHILNDITQRKLDEKIQQILFEIARTSVSNNTLEDLLVVVRKELNKVMDTTNFFVALYQPETDMMKNVIFQDEKDNFQEWKAENSLSGQVVKHGKTLLLNREEVLEYAAVHNLTLAGTPSECWLGAPLTVGRQVIGAIVIQSYIPGVKYNRNNASLLEMIANELSLVIERNTMIDDLMKARDKAEESDKLKSAFLANMSHEIRTPMNGILGFTSLLSESDLTSEEKDKYIDIIQKSGQRMLNTVNDLIDISKIETGQMPVFYAKTNLKEQLQNLHAFFAAEAKDKGLELVLKDHILSEIAVIETDVTKLDSIMTNLIKNAIKYTDKGSIEIGGVVKNQWFEFYVHDTGIGIPRHRQKAIFNRFEQADINDKRAYQGSGLGLTIARAYVEMLGGTIELESEPAVGSVFKVRLPVKSNAGNHEMMNNAKKNKDVKNDLKVKVLIAEDDSTGLEYLSIILNEINCEIITASNGEEVVALYKENQDVDIILMDIRMPVMDGYQATRLIRELNRNVFIIAQTAFALIGDKEKAIEAGCNEYLSKPVDRKKLIQMIRNYTNSIS